MPLVLILLFSWMAPGLGQAPELPIFNAHIHYSQSDWETLSPHQVLTFLEKAGVRQALVSSTPDDGTLKLYQADATRIVPFLRPYRTREDMGNWHSDREVRAYVEERLKRGVYRGIGEFHLSAADADKPVVKRLAELAAKEDIFLHAHVDEVGVEKLLRMYPDVKILWAHAGMSSPVSEVRRIVGGFPRVWVELSMRTDVASGGTLNPEWRALFMKHADRFMVGTDTWTTSRWDVLVEEARATRRWLAQLPRDVAEQIAYRNGERLFGRP
jgi:hypothetical protein